MSFMALVNIIAMVAAVILCGVMGCESHKNKRSMERSRPVAAKVDQAVGSFQKL